MKFRIKTVENKIKIKEMKKMMMGLVACTLFITSCSQNEVTDNDQEQKLIGFNNLNDRLTKAANDSISNYGVFAQYSVTPSTWFMDNIVVHGTENTYSPAQYWPKTGTVDFYAYAPQGSSNITIIDSTVGDLPLTYTVPLTADEDFTIATPAIDKTEATGTVALSFKHMLSKITVAADLTQDLKDAGYSVTFSSANVTVAKTTGSTNLTTAADLGTTSGDATTYSGRKSYMFLPQESVGVKIQLKDVTIKYGSEVYLNNKDLLEYTIETDNVSTNNFVSNTHYAVNFTIQATSKDSAGNPIFGGAIQFSSILADWTDSTVAINQP